jgi:hypothetical protein
MAAQVRERSVATDRFRESEFHWPLSGWQFEERPVASRPFAVGRNLYQERPECNAIAAVGRE